MSVMFVTPETSQPETSSEERDLQLQNMPAMSAAFETSQPKSSSEERRAAFEHVRQARGARDVSVRHVE